WRSLNGSRLPDQAYCTGSSRWAPLTVSTLGGRFLLPLSGTQIPMGALPDLVELDGSSKRMPHPAVSERDWQAETAAQSLSVRQQIYPQVHSQLVGVMSECSALLAFRVQITSQAHQLTRIPRAIVHE